MIALLPALIHCNAGKDRTGFLATVIQLLVGVPYEIVVAHCLQINDYFRPRLERLIKTLRILTLFQASPERVKLVLTAHREFLDGAFESIVERHGTVEAYLREACEIDQATLTRLKARLVS